MKKVMSVALVAAALAQPVFAATDARERYADRKDVAQAQADADNMSAVEATALRGRVLLAEILLSELRFNQGLMDRFGANHDRNVKTVVLGLARTAVPLALGVASIRYLTQPQYLQFDKSISDAYTAIAEKRSKVRELKVKQVAAAAKSESTVEKAAIDADIASLETAIVGDLERVNGNEMGRSFGRRAWKKSRVYLGYGIAFIAAADGVASLTQMVINPAYGDDVEARLTRFIDNANDTLARR